MSRTYRNQFPVEFHPEAEVVSRLGSLGWVDQSWGNDANPSWAKGGWELFVAPVRREDREWAGLPRFGLYDTGANLALESESLDEILAHMASLTP